MANVYRPVYRDGKTKEQKVSKIWWYRFQVAGKQYRGSTNESVKSNALKVLALEIARVEKELKGIGEIRHNFNAVMMQFLDEYVPPRFGHLREKTAKRYESSCRKLAPFFLGKYLDEITPGLIMEYINMRALEGIASKTIGNDIGTLSSMFTFASEYGYIQYNPAINLKRGVKKRLKKFKEQRRYLTPQEEGAILQCLHLMQDSHNDRLVEKESELSDVRRDLIIFDIETGLRKTELFHMAISNLELDNKNRTTGNPEPQVRIIGKGGKERIVPLTKRALNSLPSKCWSKLTPPETIVFPNPKTGKPFTSLLHGLKLAAERAGIKGAKELKVHDLRRTYACRYLQKNPKDYWRLMKLLGHSSLDVTMKSYAFLENEHLHEGMEHENN